MLPTVKLLHLLPLSLHLLLSSRVDAIDNVLAVLRVKEGPSSASDFRLSVRPLLQARMSADVFSRLGNVHFYKGEQAQPFVINSNGEIGLQSPLDREQICSRPGQRPDLGGSGRDALRRIRHDTSCSEPEVCCLRLRLSVHIAPLNRAQVYYVHVIVEDANDCRPVFDNSFEQRHVSVSEAAPLGYEISLPTATDADSAENGILEYRLGEPLPAENGSFDSYFELLDNRPPALAPKLRLIRVLDYEVRREFALILSAVDRGSPQLTGTMTLIIEIKDVNDCVPRIVDFLPGLTIAVNESDGRRMNHGGRRIASFSVEDADSGQNSVIQCSIKSPSPVSRYFKVQQIGRQSHQSQRTYWELSAQVHLDYEDVSMRTFSFQIVAKDSGSPALSSSVSVSIILLNIHDEPMQISFLSRGELKNRVEVSENQPSGLTLATVEVKDRDIEMSEHYQSLTCRLAADISKAFVLDEFYSSSREKAYSLRTVVSLDRELNSSFGIEVACKDNRTGDESSARLTVIVKDENDCPPEFSSPLYEGAVAENSPSGTPVSMANRLNSNLQIQAADRDAFPNNKIIYRLHGDSAAFAIDTSGRLFVRGDLDFERQSEYSFNVTAENENSPNMSSTTQVVVLVTDVNDNPPEILGFDRGYRFTVLEEISNVSVGFINATDADKDPRNAVLQFRILPVSQEEARSNGMSPDAQKYFQIEGHTGELKIVSPIDRETHQQFQFRVVAENTVPLQLRTVENGASMPHSSITMVQVSVKNVNDHAPKLCRRLEQTVHCVEPDQPLLATFDSDSALPVFIDKPVTPAEQRCVPFSYRVFDPDEPADLDCAVDCVASISDVAEETMFGLGRGHPAPGAEFSIEGSRSRMLCIRRLPASGRIRQRFSFRLRLVDAANQQLARAYQCRIVVARIPIVSRPEFPSVVTVSADSPGAVSGGFGVGRLGPQDAGGRRTDLNNQQFADDSAAAPGSSDRRQFVVVVTLITVLVFIVVIAFAIVLFFYVKRIDQSADRDLGPNWPLELHEQSGKLLPPQQQPVSPTHATIRRFRSSPINEQTHE